MTLFVAVVIMRTSTKSRSAEMITAICVHGYSQGVFFMNHLSLKLLADTVESRRKALKIAQAQLSIKTDINRAL